MHLLVYETDNGFALTPSVRDLVALDLVPSHRHGFRSAAYFSPSSLGPGDFCMLFPAQAEDLAAHAAARDDKRARGVRTMVISADLASGTYWIGPRRKG
jgi:hypothetical protein